MCGIAGLLQRSAIAPGILSSMGNAIAHRGPDDQGIWQDDDAGIGLSHRRLSIVDLSPAGHQPMEGAGGRFVIVYNGEIYNHRELRAAIDASANAGGGSVQWRGESDTEVLLEGIARWGLEETLRRSVGMFSLALWDRKERMLHLARDRFGEKPLYYGWVGGGFAFASELKALRAIPGFDNAVSRHALGQLASRAFVPAPLSIYEGIFKLLPGHVLSLGAASLSRASATPPIAGTREDGMLLTPFWSYHDVVDAGLRDPFASEEDALEALESALADSIRGQAVADVPVGAFLSGGIDSSTVVALYRKYTTGTVRTFSIGFEEAGFNEADHAAIVAAHFGTEHHEHYVSVAAAQEIIPQLPRIYDEPFADASQIPTRILSGFARQSVTVALSGDGGDELFGGYNRHAAVPRAWGIAKRVPQPLRRVMGGGVELLPAAMWNRLAQSVPGWGRPEVGAKLHKAARMMARSNGFADAYASFLDQWDGEPSPILDADGAPARSGIGAGWPDPVRAMYLDAVSYLPDDVMCKVDRAAMAVSLETRAPFLDHRVAEVAARIPIAMNIADGTGKRVLRNLLFRQAPQALFDRPKAGFAVPVGEWIKGPLRDWAESLLDPRRLAEQGLVDAHRVRGRWAQHLSGQRNSEQAIWTMLMLQAWIDAQETGLDEAPVLGAAA
ncbi:asparagine synthase (glutamine-hydrolyzing) [Sphingomonas sp. LM7]|uniref:asparagine synthase (glutamine-hydrolyzing) n=1 Tax=Sphingomonas sp. LM7 TaxID=1938607 RepID=UPI000983C150|nr:asparagine synthase (glutamine-hydrolyzing) [Sphingomonas sp. LM7]AQR75533.1 asparagine synthase (glutamine-hydrolyzing) [Sphingomonas sp. LM7]